jgi:WD40 repeat protein
MAELIPITLKHDDYISAVAFSPDGTLLATGAGHNHAYVWDISTGELIATLKHVDDVLADVTEILFSPDGKLLVTIAAYTAKVWDIPSGRLIATLSHSRNSIIEYATFNSDGSLLATVGWGDATVSIWILPSGRLKTILRHDARQGPSATSVKFDSSGSTILTTFWREVYLWDASSGRLIDSEYVYDRVEDISIIPDQNMVVVLMDDIELRDMPSWKYKLTLNHNRKAKAFALNHDGTLLATISYDSILRIFEIPLGRIITAMKYPEVIDRIYFAPNGALLAVGGKENTTLIWSITSEQPLATVQHDSIVTAFAFSPDFKVFATGSYDKKVKLWIPDVNNTPNLLAPPNKNQYIGVLPELKWEELPNSLYQVHISNDSDLSKVAFEVYSSRGAYQINLGELIPGAYYWRVRSVGWINFGEWSSSRQFTLGLVPFPDAPMLISPLPESEFTTELPLLIWQYSLGAKAYTLQIATDEAFSDIVYEKQTTKSEFLITQKILDGGKEYHWRVNAIGASGAGDWSTPWKFSFSPETIPPIPFDLTSPGNGAWTNGIPSFDWRDSSDDVKLSHYQLWVDGNLFQDYITESRYTVTEAQSLPSGLHTWTVKAIDGVGNITQANQTWSIRVDGDAPAPYALLAPDDNSWRVDPFPVLAWQASSDAESGLVKYRLYMDDKI